MKFSYLVCAILCAPTITSAGPIPDAHLASKSHSTSLLGKRQQIDQGQVAGANGTSTPFSGNPFLKKCGGRWLTHLLDETSQEFDLPNTNSFGVAGTDNGVVPNLKWSLSDSHKRLFKGGWIREQVVTDLPSSKDLAAAQLHLIKGAIRELHWHRVVRRKCGLDISPLNSCRPNLVTSLLARYEWLLSMKRGRTRSPPWKQEIFGIFQKGRHT